jgi:adenosylcobinamide hydrolase
MLQSALSTRMIERADWKSSAWFGGPAFEAYRHGRFIVTELKQPHHVISTSSCVGGSNTALRHLVNHQSCEGAGHVERLRDINELGPEGYHSSVCAELGLNPATTSVMGTAANMMYAAHESVSFNELRVDAIVTAGVEGNATCAGDPANWIETPTGWNKLAHVAGTINTMMFVNQPMMPEALVRALLTITEGKTSALAELGVSSRYSQNLATGTGTDQVCIAAPLTQNAYAYKSASPHTKLGELLGMAACNATKTALRWQNGLEASLTRSLVHALRRFGFSETAFLAAMRLRVTEGLADLAEKNKNSILFEPQVAAAAYAFAAVWDRVRFGILPAAAACEILRQQGATIAASLAARPRDWASYWQQLNVDMNRPLDAVYDALAIGWTAKWSKD